MDQSESISCTVPEDVLFRRIGDELVFLNLETGFYYGLNPVGCRIWELVTSKLSLDEIVATMLTEYDTSEERLRNDILRLLAELIRKGLLADTGIAA